MIILAILLGACKRFKYGIITVDPNGTNVKIFTLTGLLMYYFRRLKTKVLVMQKNDC